jgi:hypothetical protein
LLIGITTGELHVDGGKTVLGTIAICPVTDVIGTATGDDHDGGTVAHVITGENGIIAVLNATVLGKLFDGTTVKQCYNKLVVIVFGTVDGN